MSVDIPRAALSRFLAALDDEAGGYAFAKGVDPWETLQGGGDWDIVVRDAPRATLLLCRELGLPAHAVSRSYVTNYVYAWGSVDLVSYLGWRGREILAVECVVAGARRSGGVVFARPAHQAISSWILPALYSGTFDERYAAAVATAVRDDGEELRTVLTRAFGSSIAGWLLVRAAEGHPEEAARTQRRLRRAASVRAARRPVGTLAAWSSHAARELSLRMSPPLPTLEVADEADVADVVRWAYARRLFVRGVSVSAGKSAYFVAIPRHDTRDDLLARLRVQLPSSRRLSPLSDRLMRTRGWITVRQRRGTFPDADLLEERWSEPSSAAVRSLDGQLRERAERLSALIPGGAER